jgi:ubiquinone/menaquinone biosynthesis C-methylase UbiE
MTHPIIENKEPHETEMMIPLLSREFGSWRFRLDRHALAPEKIRTRYNKAAATWHAMMRRMGYPASYRQALRAMLAACSLRHADGALSVLDCGTGSGTLALAFARVYAAPFSLVATDTSDHMLDQARQRFDHAGITASTQHADVRRLPFADNSFDVVMSAHLLEHLHDPKAALTEMARVTRPGGVIILCLTRRGLLGLYIHLTWRTRLYAVDDVQPLAGVVGLQDLYLPRLSRLHPLRHLSITCICRKPFDAAEQ